MKSLNIGLKETLQHVWPIQSSVSRLVMAMHSWAVYFHLMLVYILETAVKRLMREAEELKESTEDYYAQPLEVCSYINSARTLLCILCFESTFHVFYSTNRTICLSGILQ